MRVNAVVLAGAANQGALREVDPAPNEALIPIAGKPMIQYVIDGLRASGQVDRILVVAPSGQIEPHIQDENLEFVAAQDHIVDNVLVALSRLPQDQKVMIASSDIPLITGEAVRGLLDLCAEREADLYYPIIERAVAERFYPGVKRTYVTLQEGTFTGGNIFVVNPQVADHLAPKVRGFLDNRKNPVKMAGLLGWSFVLRLLLKRLSLKGLEEHVSRIWGIRGAVVICPYPEVGVDVDKPSDLELARATLEKALTG